ncbi:hypothetical protein Pth03_78120 [Planotetraspora thailandica]|uniref:Uncharacterized protein n=1 Tax=Planotetraspora thailandica TaxID=487172 RepID=A0A8J3Y213_9ACTN|nr:hypothetical protein [Planotetraspora thailandica]GII59423.1 hypothetical protein Pth03_78120 [Planotetraspora thailandica]
MSDSEQAAGKLLAVSARTGPVQPPETNASALTPVSLADMLRGMPATRAAEARQLQESLERRASDQRLRDELARCNFTGDRYQRFEEELARYGMSVLRGWMYTGYIFKLTASRKFALSPSEAELEELHRDSDAREELATMTVALALPKFRQHALVEGGWRYEGGASLPTYFMGACLYIFPNEFRKRRVQQKKWTRAHIGEAVTLDPEAGLITSVEAQALGDMRVRDDLGRVDARTRAIVALTIDGYTQEEIVELLDETSIRAVEGALYRWRKSEQRHLQGGDRS